MTTIINQGFLELTDGSNTFLVYFERLYVDLVREPTIEHIEGGVNYGYDLLKQFLKFYVQNVTLTSHSDFSSFVDYITDWQDAGTFTLKVKRDSTHYIEWDGDNTSFTVLLAYPGFQKMEKIAPGDQDTLYQIQTMIFEEAG